MTKSVASDPNAYVVRYRALVERLEAETDKKVKAKLKTRAEVMKKAWKKWQGEDSLYEMAFGEPVE